MAINIDEINKKVLKEFDEEEKRKHYEAFKNFNMKEAIKANPEVVKELADYILYGEKKD